MKVAISHDHLLHRGGSERVLLSMHAAFPDSPIYTAFYDPARTFSRLRDLDIRPLRINNVRLFHRNHRLALPFLARAFESLEVEADVLLCSSSGWAHGARTSGKKVVYCYSPANWLYRRHHYVRRGDQTGALAATLVRPWLTKWDQRMARTADSYLTSSSAVRERIRAIYGIDAQVIPPPVTIDASGPQEPVRGVTPGFYLNVSRLVAHKNVDALVAAFGHMSTERLVIVGDGPLRPALKRIAGRNVSLLGIRTDPELRWLYANCAATISASHEDFGLTPLEAASFGNPSVVLRWGGFLDTVVEGHTGVFFDDPDPVKIVAAIKELRTLEGQREELIEHSKRFSEESYVRSLQQAVAESQ